MYLICDALNSHLFTILPVGVVSKNDIGERRTRFNIPACKFDDPRTVTNPSVIAPNIIDIAGENKI